MKSSIHPCIGHWVAIGRGVVYYGRAAHAFNAGIKCRHGIGDGDGDDDIIMMVMMMMMIMEMVMMTMMMLTR